MAVLAAAALASLLVVGSACAVEPTDEPATVESTAVTVDLAEPPDTLRLMLDYLTPRRQKAG
ncbi:MAG: hypothetical protein AAGD38_23830, partial [Acidobacteriota bacterium]